MKKWIVVIGILLAPAVYAGSRDMIRHVPSNSLFVLGADFSALRSSDLYTDLESKGQIWSYDPRSELPALLQSLQLDPKEVKAALYSKYINSYGSKGEVHVFEVMKDLAPLLNSKEATPYSGAKMYRIHEDQDLFAVMLNPETVAIGKLNGVKMALDVDQGKTESLKTNSEMAPLMERIPPSAGVWGIAWPLSRRQAADAGAGQSTNAVLEAFNHYYFYGIPAKKTVRSHFIGQAKGEAEATFVRTFLIGTLTFAKFRAKDDKVVDALDQVNIDRSGKNIHVSANVNSDMVDAYFNGDLGVK